MGRVTTMVFLAGTLSAAALAAAQAGGGGAQQPSNATLPIVGVLGCLTAGPNKTWTLADATDPTTSNSAATTADAVKAAQSKPLGTQRFVLIGVNQFDPAPHKGHKMAIKGILIK